MNDFWEGFEKRAAGAIEEWQEESEEADSKAKKDGRKQPAPDLTTERHGMPPDTYWRSWP